MPRKHSPKNSLSLSKLEKNASPKQLALLHQNDPLLGFFEKGDPIQGPHYPVVIPQKGEQWDCVQGYSGQKCHICSSDVIVRSGPLEFVGPTFHTTFLWFLCEVCHDKGWQIPTVRLLGNVYRLVYKNTKTKKTALVDVLEVTKIEVPRRS